MKLITDKLEKNITNPQKKTQCNAYKIRFIDELKRKHYLVTSSGKQIWNSLNAAKSALRLMFQSEHDAYMYGFDDVTIYHTTGVLKAPYIRDSDEREKRSVEFIQKLYASVEFVKLTDASDIIEKVESLKLENTLLKAELNFSK